MANNSSYWAKMLYEEPEATGGLKTSASDPLSQIASWYQFGANLRNGAEARRADRDRQDQIRREAEAYRNDPANQQAANAISATGEGIYGVNSMLPQPNGGGIGVSANGITGIPGGQNGGNVPLTWGDFGTNSGVLGSLGGGNLDKLVTTSGIDLLGGLLGKKKEPDNTMNITDQTIGQNYNSRIDGQVGGLNIPRTPSSGFGQAINNVDNSIGAGDLSGASANFLNPIASGNSARVADGETGFRADNPYTRSKRFLDEKYDKMAYIKQALASGVKNPLVALDVYDNFIAPIREEARQDELRNAFFILQNPNSSEQDIMNAMSLIEYYKGDPFLEETAMEKLGLMPNPDYNGGGDNDTGEYGGDDENAAAIYSHLASKGYPPNVIAGIMGNLQQESGFSHDAFNPNDGDGLPSGGIAQWHAGRFDNLKNYASQRGTNWNDRATQLDFLLDEINGNYPDLLEKMSKLSPDEAAKLFHDEFEKSNDSPEVIATRGQNALNIYNNRKVSPKRNGNKRYIENPNPKWKQKEDYKHALAIDRINRQQAGQQKLAYLKSQLKGDKTKNGSSNSKNSKNSSDLHEALNSLVNIESKYNKDLAGTEKEKYEKNYNTEYDKVKNAIIKEYPDIKEGVSALKGKGLTLEDVGSMLAKDIYKNNNVKGLNIESLSDIVSEILTSSNHGDTTYDTKDLSSKLKKRLQKELSMTNTLRNRSKRDVSSFDTIFGGYYDRSKEGLTDRDIADMDGTNKKEAINRILSEGEKVGKIKYENDMKLKENNKTEIERLLDEVERHKGRG